MVSSLAFAKAQLRERMVEFWTDHFNISIDTVGFLKMVDDREVIRPHALGNFGTLLRATAHSGAMLRYLDQNTSRTPTPNMTPDMKSFTRSASAIMSSRSCWLAQPKATICSSATMGEFSRSSL